MATIIGRTVYAVRLGIISKVRIIKKWDSMNNYYETRNESGKTELMHHECFCFTVEDAIRACEDNIEYWQDAIRELEKEG